MNRAVLCMTSRHKNLLYIICLKIKVQKKKQIQYSLCKSLCLSDRFHSAVKNSEVLVDYCTI